MTALAEETARAAHAAPPPPIRTDPAPGFGRFALHVLYDGIWLLGILVGAPWWIARSTTDPVFRRMVLERLGIGLRVPPAAGRRVLVHGVSVGEVKATRSIVERLRAARPDLEIVISTTTATGQEVARRLYPELAVVRFPFDLSVVVRRFLRRVDPACVVLVELEVWPNFLRVANRRGVPIAVVNGRITVRSHARYLRFRSLMPQFRRITLFCAQDEVYARRFEAHTHEPSRILVTGNVKADTLRLGRAAVDVELERFVAAAPGRTVLVAGSTHDPEERMVTEAWRASGTDARLVLVPRHPGRAPTIQRELAALGAQPQRLTQLRSGAETVDPSRPLLVDTIGELDSVYALADLVLVGGSLIPHGGQNMLEPASQGVPAIYGPHVGNFPHETSLLEAAGASRRLTGIEELPGVLVELLGDAEARERMGRAALEAVRAQQGATEETVRALLDRCLPAVPALADRPPRS